MQDVSQVHGVILGTARDALTGFPLEGAAVTALAGGGRAAESRTGAGGYFCLDHLDPGTYTVVGGAEGYGRDCVGALVEPGREASTALNLLPFAGSLSGTVKDAESGQPLPDAALSIHNSLGLAVAYAEADPNGAWRVNGLLEDVYVLTFSAPGRRNTATSARVKTGRETVADIVMPGDGGTIAGTIAGPGGTGPLAGARVILYDQENTIHADLFTDGRGCFTVRGLPAGSYKIVAGKPGFAAGWQGAISMAGQADSVEIVLDLPAGGVAGTILDENGRSVSSAVTLHTAAGLPLITQAADAAGNFSFQDLGPGGYFLQARAAGYAAAAAIFAIAPGETDMQNLQFRLSRNRASVGGRVSSSGGPAAGVAVTATDTGGHALARTITGTDGDYLLEDLPAANLILVAGGPGHVTEAFPLALSTGQRLAFDAHLQNNPCKVLKRVKDAQGLPADGAQVRVADAEGRYLGLVLTGWDGLFWLRAWSQKDPRPLPWQWGD